MDSPGTPKASQENRRSPRFELLVPIEVAWTDAAGQEVTQRAEVVEANQSGGLLVLHDYPGTGQRLTLTNLLSGESAEARAVAFRHSRDGSVKGVAVELVSPEATDVWGITYRLRRASAELKKLMESLKEGTTKGLDLHVLREFRDAVDYVRKTAWIVYEWQERQVHHRDTATVLPLLTSERIRRATQLCHAILEDIAEQPPERYPGELSVFYKAVAQVYERLAPLLGAHQPRKD